MKRIILLCLLICLEQISLHSQDNTELSVQQRNQLGKIIELIKNDKIGELSSKIVYPLKRPNPIPNIKTKEEFIKYYPVLFDNDFKAKLINAEFDNSNTINTSSGLGLFDGALWLNDNGEIITVNHRSPQEESLVLKLTKEIEQKIHQTVKPWKENILVCKCEKFFIRIDLMDDDIIRYISWGNSKNIAEKPDLILFDGIQEFHGTMGGVSYTFKNQDWSYQIDKIDLSGDDNNDASGLFLKLYQNEKLKKTFKCEEIK